MFSVFSPLAGRPAWADEIVSVKAGYLSLNPEGSFAVDNSGLSGTKIDFDDDLNFDNSEDSSLKSR